MNKTPGKKIPIYLGESYVLAHDYVLSDTLRVPAGTRVFVQGRFPGEVGMVVARAGTLTLRVAEQELDMPGAEGGPRDVSEAAAERRGAVGTRRLRAPAVTAGVPDTLVVLELAREGVRAR